MKTEVKVESDMQVDDAPTDDRPVCQYGMNCYRNNPAHFREFQHPPGHPKGVCLPSGA